MPRVPSKEIDIDDLILLYPKNVSVYHEAGGYVDTTDKRVKFIQTVTSDIDKRNGRKHVQLPLDRKVIWHTHPMSDGFWPSVEDIALGFGNRVNLIFTRYGVWAYKGNDKLSPSGQKDIMKITQDLHDVFVVMTQAQWRVPDAKRVIKHFLELLQGYDYDISFYSEWNLSNQLLKKLV